MPTPKLYTIGEQAQVSEATTSAIAADPKADDVYEALIWRLARDPECGTPFVSAASTESRLVFVPSLRHKMNPALLAKYRFLPEEEKIWIDWVQFYPYDEAQAIDPPKAFDLHR